MVGYEYSQIVEDGEDAEDHHRDEILGGVLLHPDEDAYQADGVDKKEEPLERRAA